MNLECLLYAVLGGLLGWAFATAVIRIVIAVV